MEETLGPSQQPCGTWEWRSSHWASGRATFGSCRTWHRTPRRNTATFYTASPSLKVWLEGLSMKASVNSSSLLTETLSPNSLRRHQTLLILDHLILLANPHIPFFLMCSSHFLLNPTPRPLPMFLYACIYQIPSGGLHAYSTNTLTALPPQLDLTLNTFSFNNIPTIGV